MEKKRITLADLDMLKKSFQKSGLHTVCQSAKCPNIGECFKNKTATFMILGNICTRNCLFCATEHGVPLNVDINEPQKLADTVKMLGLNYIVITSVTRDDLIDGGANHFGSVVSILKKEIPSIKIEVLTPDFKGSKESLDIVCASGIDVFGHNIETVPSLYNFRKGANYYRSLEALSYVKKKGFVVKTGIMLGLGETQKELTETFKDLKSIDCDILTIGQYLQPAKSNAAIVKEYTDEDFEYIKNSALQTGIKVCISGRYVRSSYFADSAYKLLTGKQ